MYGARPEGTQGDAGFMMAAVIVMVFLVLLALTVAAPRIAMSIKRDRELEAQHRANQYVRGIRLYYKKFGHYPGSIEQLQKSNNQRFVRQKYLDPMTGKDDWRLIHVGENKTKVKGFFGEDLPGLAGGLGSASSLSNGTGSTTGNSTSAFNNSGIGGAGASGQGTTATGGVGNGGTGTGGTSSTGSTGTNAGTGTSSQSADDLKGTGGPIMGVGSSATGEAILTVNEQTNYQDWEFLYDPRIEQLYAKGNLLGGGGLTSGSSSGNGLGTAPVSNGFPGQTNNPGGNGTNGANGTNGTNGSNGLGTTPQ